MSFVHRAFTEARPNTVVEVYGFDVLDHGVQEVGFLNETTNKLSSDIPDVVWRKRIKTLRIHDTWDFPEDHFDVVMSNQVLEHVNDKSFFFGESHRVLREGGYAIHLAPLVHYVYEGHLNLPLVHRFRSHDMRYSYISLLSLIGLGKFGDHHKRTGVSRSEYSMMHADYICFNTSYSSEKETLNMSRNAGFRTSFRFTREFYKQKLRKVFRQPLKSRYRNNRSALSDSLSVKVLRYVSSVTLVCEKRNTYVRHAVSGSH